MAIDRIISGGQTGADRGGLDVAIALDIPHGGWCPRGRRAENGRIPQCYNLEEAPACSYPVRTRLNVKAADGTVIFTDGPITRGSALTLRTATQLGIPVKHINLAVGMLVAAKTFCGWLTDCEQSGTSIRTLNVAGSRESRSPGIRGKVYDVLWYALAEKRVDDV